MISRVMNEELEGTTRIQLLQARNADGNSEALNALCDVVNELRIAIEILNEGGRIGMP